MPLPTLVFIAFGVGVSAALVGGTELRLSPRHAVLTSSFKAYALFLTLIVLPISIYFYVFHGDWFLLYAADVRRIPSAVALIGFMAECAIGVVGFQLGAGFARNQRIGLGYAISGAAGVAALAVVALWPERLSVVGTFAQYRGDFGLRTYSGDLMQAGIAMGAVLAFATVFLLARIRLASRKS
jgi:hypothetical protein